MDGRRKWAAKGAAPRTFIAQQIALPACLPICLPSLTSSEGQAKKTRCEL